jgi:BMFP domain-containing protein YqiC
MQNLTVGDYYRIGADDEEALTSEDGSAEYTIGKFVRTGDVNGVTQSDSAMNTYYVFEDANTYTVNSTTPIETETEVIVDSNQEDPLFIVHIGTKEDADNIPSQLNSDWASQSEAEDVEQGPPETTTTTTTSNPTSSVEPLSSLEQNAIDYKKELDAINKRIAELEARLNEEQSKSNQSDTTTDTENPQGGRKKSIKGNRHRNRRVTYRLRRRT